MEEQNMDTKKDTPAGDKSVDTPTPEEAEELELNMAEINAQKIRTEQANEALLRSEQRLKEAQAAKAEEEAAKSAATTDKLVSENQQVMIDNRMKVLEQLQKKLELGLQVTGNDAMLLYGTTEILGDDLADSVEERAQMQYEIQRQLQMLQQLSAPVVQRSPEMSVVGIQQQEML